MTESVYEDRPVASPTGLPPRFMLAVPAGIGAAIVGALLWATVVYLTEFALGLFAVGVGALVGVAIRAVGRGGDRAFGILGGACAAFGWALGTILCDIAFLAQNAGRPFLDVLPLMDLSSTASLALAAADVMDLVFLAIAVYEGYRLSIIRG
jgi:hypothetical protein